MSSVVSLIILTADVHSERRFDLHTSVKQLKTKLEQITGIPSDSQRLLLYNNEDDANANKGPISDLGDEERALGYFGIRDGLAVKVIDTNPSTSFAGEFSDVSRVEKFEISEEEYAKRQDTVLAYKQLHKVGRFAPQPTTSEPLYKALPEVVVGARCEVIIDNMAKRGTVRFVGETEFGKVKGDWVGVEYDEPVGKNDGSVEGKRYFTCRPSCGAFIRPDKVKIGDFPELSLEDEEM